MSAITPAEFWSSCEKVLLAEEPLNALPIGIIQTLISDPTRYKRYHLAALSPNGVSVSPATEESIIGCTWMTPPHPLGMTDMPRALASHIVDWADSLGDRPRGFVGPTSIADIVTDMWCKRSGTSVAKSMGLIAHVLTAVKLPVHPGGKFRDAGSCDTEVIAAMTCAYTEETGLGTVDAAAAIEIRNQTARAIEMGTRVVWEAASGDIVACAGAAGPTPRGVRIGNVYTLPAHRGRGYAAALVAAMSQRELDRGKAFCSLYTDAANPTSNSIYRKIGYRRIGDSIHHTLK